MTHGKYSPVTPQPPHHRPEEGMIDVERWLDDFLKHPEQSAHKNLRRFAAEVLRDAAKDIDHNPIKLRLRLLAARYEEGRHER